MTVCVVMECAIILDPIHDLEQHHGALYPCPQFCNLQFCILTCDACIMIFVRLLLEGGYEIDVVFTSRLKRAIRTVWIILTELNEVYLPCFKSWRLQERHYGALTGLSKKELAEQIGADLVQTWCVHVP